MINKRHTTFASPKDLEKDFRAYGRRFFYDDKDKIDGIEMASDISTSWSWGDLESAKSTFLRKAGLEALKGSKGFYRPPLTWPEEGNRPQFCRTS